MVNDTAVAVARYGIKKVAVQAWRRDKPYLLWSRLSRWFSSSEAKKVLLDADLARLYGTTTGALNQAVKRNARRFPPDFFFSLTASEKREVITNCDHLRSLKFSPRRPFAFTEHGAIMAASVLNTQRAIEVGVYVVRTFVKLREMLASHKELAHKLAELERKVGDYDQSIQTLVAAIRQLMTPPPPPDRGRIGFERTDEP